MAEKEKSLDLLVEGCLEGLSISLLADWDVLVFLYRHQLSLTSAAQIARLLGYPGNVVSEALDRLEPLGLVRRSRAYQGVRLYQFVFSEPHTLPQSLFQQLMRLAENRAGRLLVAKKLRQREGLHLAKGNEPWPKAV